MTRKSMILCTSLLALLCAAAFAGGFEASGPTTEMSSALSVGIGGCIASGGGDFICLANANGGSGSYNYWFQHSGNGSLYQTNTSSARINDCHSGSFTIRVSIRDRATGHLAQSAPLTVSCGSGGGLGGGLF